MARGRGGGRGRGGFRGRGKNRGSDRRDVRTEAWSDIERKNDLYESYYRAGGFLEEQEFEQMWKYLASDLPNSFRFTGTKSDALAVREIFKKRYIPGITAVEFEGRPVQPPEPVKAFPDELVWDMKTHKKVVRRHKPFAEFQKFLVAETTSGNISRQEVVSMIPPHFLDVRPGMVVLDMCAAPGSKSAQLAEMIHGDEEERVARAAKGESFDNTFEGDYSDDGRSTGLLIANDTDYKRAGMLVHQVKRLNFPNLIVTQHDASIFPSIELPAAPGADRKQYLKFDRVLADVPCSGDGTARKNPNVWQKWTPKDGLGLHNLQLRILSRGLQLLKKGGRIVYSTCSMNPVENEAVVASAIAAAGGTSKVQIVDCSDHLPGLIRKPGLTQWKVLDTSHINGEDKANHMFSTWEKFSEAKAKYDKEEPGRTFSNKIAPGVFAPIAKSEEERIPLERCIRVYPHLQDTGGFFIAVLEKLDDIKAAPQTNTSDQTQAATANANSTDATPALLPPESDKDIKVGLADEVEDIISPESNALKRKSEDLDEIPSSKRVKNEIVETDTNRSTNDLIKQEATTTNGAAPSEDMKEPIKQEPKPYPLTKLKPENQSNQKEYFEYLPADDPTIDAILSFFGISDRFPRDRFLVRNKEGLLLNKIYYTSALAKTVIQQNVSRGMKFVHCGVVMFVSHRVKDNVQVQATWRLQNEGIRILEPWASKRIITCNSRDVLYKMLIEMFPKLPKDGNHELGELGDQLAELPVGCSFLRVEKSEGDDDNAFPFRMVFPVWRHPGSVNLMVDKDDRKAILLRLYNEIDPVIKNHIIENAKREKEENNTISSIPELKKEELSEDEQGANEDVKAEDVKAEDVEMVQTE